MIGICKSFGANKVLGGVNLHVRPGEVHALMGENGAGKSTLMNILTGIHRADAGTIMVDGKEVTFKNNKDAEEHGIAFIHQELNIWPNLSVLENLFLMNQPKTRFGTIDFKKMREMAEAKCQEIGIDLPLDEIAGECSVGQQQMTEITRSLMLDAKTVIMDEPTAALTERETDRLFEVMKKLKNKGVSIIYISHRMEEVFANCDTITVMRDGQTISSRPTEETNMDQIVGDMVGRVMSEYYPARTNVPGDEIFRVEGFTQPGVFRDISFNLRKGEILGVAGLMGAGRTEIMRAIFGVDPHESGKLYFEGKEILSLPFSMARDLAVRQAAWRRAAAMVRQVLDRGQDMAMVVLGDVSIYSTYCYLMELLREEGYETEMIPGVASFSAVAARLGVSLTTMEEPLHILPASQQAQWEGLTLPGTKVLMKSGRSLKDLVEKLAETGQLEQAVLVANCGLDQEMVCTDLRALPEGAGYYTTILVKE